MKTALPWFERNKETGKIQLAPVKLGGIFISQSLHSSTTTTTRYIERKDGFDYLQALNMKNAIRKFNKL